MNRCFIWLSTHNEEYSAEHNLGTIGADAATIAAGSLYLRWFIPSMALQFAIAAMSAALQGTGVVKPTMVVQLLGLLINIVLTPILVAGWGTGRPLGVLGAGLASTLAAVTGVAMMAFYFVRLERYVRFDRHQLRPHPAILRRMLGIGWPAGAEFLLMFVYMAVTYTVIRELGAAAQAGYGIGVRMTQALFLPPMAIAFAVPAIAGQNFGARNAARVRQTFFTAAGLNVTVMTALTLFCQWRPAWLVRGFATDAEILAVATSFMLIISWNFIATGLVLTCSGLFQALGNTLPALASSATRLVTYVGPAFWLARRPDFQIEHVWYLSVTTVALQMVISLLLLRGQLARRLRFAAPGAKPAAAS